MIESNERMVLYLNKDFWGTTLSDFRAHADNFFESQVSFVTYSGTVVLQWYYSGTTVVLQWYYSGTTVVLQSVQKQLPKNTARVFYEN